jgi:endogenous inhibitor of DNA gyrase (YacG/DUF329 family)
MIKEENDESWMNVIPKYHKCPHCSKGVLEQRIKRGFWVRNFFIWMHVKRYQCNTCQKRVYIKNDSPKNNQLSRV